MLDKVWDYIKNDMKPELIVSIFIMIFIAILAIILGHKIKKADPYKAPKGGAFVADYLVEFSMNTVNKTLGTAYEKFVPYFVFLVLYVPISFMIGLLALPSPMNIISIPLSLAIVSWLGIQISSIYFNKLGYLKSFCSPLPPWLPIMAPINLLGKVAPLISLTLRMFGNSVAGFSLMALVYWATGMVSDLVFSFTNLNLVAPFIAPILHAYFDVFSAAIQTLIFVTLTLLLISVEIPAPVARKEKPLKEEKVC